MNTFVEIRSLDRFTETPVKIYTVQVFDEDEPRNEWEFTNWRLRHGNISNIEKEYRAILSWIQMVSTGKLNLQTVLRHEKRAHAFPPKGKFLKVVFHENLRLYCMVIGNGTIILFNGGIKSKKARTAEDCHHVRPYFRLANSMCQAIENGIFDKSLEIDYDSGKIITESYQRILL